MDETETAVLIVGVLAACIIVSKFLFRARSSSRQRNYARNLGRDYDVPIAPPLRETWSITLQVDAMASAEEIRRAYRELISKYHPDKMNAMEPAVREHATRRSQEINVAYRAAMQSRMVAE